MIKLMLMIILILVGMSIVDTGLNDYYSSTAPTMWNTVFVGIFFIILGFILVLFV